MTIYSGHKWGAFPKDSPYNWIIDEFDPLCDTGKKLPMKGGHTHNHKRNADDRKMFRSKTNRRWCRKFERFDREGMSHKVSFKLKRNRYEQKNFERNMENLYE